MQTNGRNVLVCNCRQTMTIAGEQIADALQSDSPVIHSELCRAQLDGFRSACRSGQPLLVGCTQEAPLFTEVAGEQELADITFVNIRERAGWSDEGGQAAAKMAALIAEASLTLQPTPAISLKSDGVVLVYGSGERAIAAAQRLSRQMSVTCLLRRADDGMPPNVMTFPLFRGTIRRVTGHLGAFTASVDGHAAALPSSRASLEFAAARDGVSVCCDILVDISGAPPLFPRDARRDGYLRAEPGDPVALERILFEATELVGGFEKPRYVRVAAALCAHARNGIVGCRNCLDVCPTGAITPDGDHVAVDPFVCIGHGACASVCPTGAVAFDLPAGNGIFQRLRLLLQTYRTADRSTRTIPPVLLVHDTEHGDAMIAAMARHGRGLPAHVLPFGIASISAVGLDFLFTALAYGAAQVRLLAPQEQRDTLQPLHRNVTVTDAVCSGLGLGSGRVVVDDLPDPDVLADLLRTPPPPPVAAATYAIMDGKQPTLRQALAHLHRHADAPAAVIPLPVGAPFGTVVLDQNACTLCLACVGVCPTQALGDDPDAPQLSFVEAQCVQCGLCRATCPEVAIALQPRLSFEPSARQRIVLKKEEPFPCARCGKPFGTRATVERIIQRLAGHAMFADGGRLMLLQLCEDCRVAAQFETAAPLASRPRPKPRTTDDYLRQRKAPDDGR